MAWVRPLLPVLIGLGIVGAGMTLLEWGFASVPGYRRFRAGWRTDLAYALMTPLVVRGVRTVAVVVALVPVAALVWQVPVRELVRGFGPVGRQPAWLQGVGMLVIADFIGYWTHRWFHGRRLWRVHAVHHCSRQLDWLAAFRVHPVNDILTGVVRAVPLVALGFAPLVLAGVLPLLTLHAIFLHANVGWRFGPFRAVISSPAFHRWHHTAAEEGRDKNFAGLFPLWDVLFGTYYMPAHSPTVFGVDEAVPAGYFAQLVWPSRSNH